MPLDKVYCSLLKLARFYVIYKLVVYTFGLIPSWGTRPNEYTYTFSNISNGASHEYSIDNVSFNHLVLFPVFWVTFLTLDESKEFESALENFIENS